MKLCIRNLKKIPLTFLIIPGVAYSFTTQTLSDSLCFNTVEKKNSSNLYRVHRPLNYEYEGIQYFLHKNEFFSLNQNTAEKKRRFLVDENAIDFFVQEDSLWTLGEKLIERDLVTGKVKNRYPTGPKGVEKRTKAKGFHYLEGKVYIAHGSLGIVVFDLSDRKFNYVNSVNTKNSRGYISNAVSVSGDSPSNLFIAMSSWKKGFEGITVYDASSNRVIHNMAYDKRNSGNVGPDAKIYHKGESVFLNNGGWIHAFKTKNILRYNSLKASWLPIVEEINISSHHGAPKKLKKYRMIKGDFIFANNQILGCTVFKNKEEGFERPISKGKAVSFQLNH